ncbi:damage-inducible protein DinB [Paenibacillus swuensis]|uniref:Damage-inducible protein DinB n=1 Tax=Paenibacillus swuensis TaxID=1178515 RepID=A0A172TF46_9BACL|nr:DinB family protein [Paenibacillus swuensis]ANE45524.1 damage-inducible protein DinB [Paenibacillus swuensis]
MSNVLRQQYEYLRLTREVLFAFLEEIPLEKLQYSEPGSGRDSIITLHVHVADCYRNWLERFGLKRTVVYATDEEIQQYDVNQVRACFKAVDELVLKFIEEFEDRWQETIENQVRWQKEPFRTTPLWLLTHTETHEFHHKGQIASMARQLGYIPPDTDLASLNL